MKAGGFLVDSGGGSGSGAADPDAIVQPFHLPRFEHGTYQPDTKQSNTNGRIDSEDHKLDFHEIGKLRAATELVANDPVQHAFGLASTASESGMDLQNENDDDDDMEEVVPAGSAKIGAVGVGEVGGAVDAPKTMQELIEEMAARRAVQGTTGALANANSISTASASVSTAGIKFSAPRIQPQPRTRRATAALGANTSPSTVEASFVAQAPPAARGRKGPANGAAMSRVRANGAGRGRGRRRKASEEIDDDSESESEEEDEIELDDSSGLSEPPDAEEDASGAGGDGSDDSDSNVQPKANGSSLPVSGRGRGQKRKRSDPNPNANPDLQVTSSKPSTQPSVTATPSIIAHPVTPVTASATTPAPTSTPTPTSGRVLRTRIPKSTSQVQAELDAERAFQRAIGKK